MTTQNIEMTLPEDSIIRKIYESAANSSHLEEGVHQSFNAPSGVKEVETDLDNETYNKLISEFINKARIHATPKSKMEQILNQKRDQRKPLKLRKGFLNGPRVSSG
jgi:hypothetical protein